MKKYLKFLPYIGLSSVYILFLNLNVGYADNEEIVEKTEEVLTVESETCPHCFREEVISTKKVTVSDSDTDFSAALYTGVTSDLEEENVKFDTSFKFSLTKKKMSPICNEDLCLNGEIGVDLTGKVKLKKAIAHLGSMSVGLAKSNFSDTVSTTQLAYKLNLYENFTNVMALEQSSMPLHYLSEDDREKAYIKPVKYLPFALVSNYSFTGKGIEATAGAIGKFLSYTLGASKQTNLDLCWAAKLDLSYSFKEKFTQVNLGGMIGEGVSEYVDEDFVVNFEKQKNTVTSNELVIPKAFAAHASLEQDIISDLLRVELGYKFVSYGTGLNFMNHNFNKNSINSLIKLFLFSKRVSLNMGYNLCITKTKADARAYSNTMPISLEVKI
jgi:hypothetical protein